MSFSNDCRFVGNLGADPEIKSLQNGDAVVNLRIATSESWRDKNSGERRERTEWHSVVIFNEQLAKVAEQYLRKGSLVYLEGQLQTRKWQDQSGQDRYSTDVVVAGLGGVMTMLDGRDGGGTPDRGQHDDPFGDSPGGGRGPASRDIEDDEIPF